MTPGDIEDLLLAYEADVAVWTRTPDKYNYAEVVANRKKIADLLEARTPQEATGPRWIPVSERLPESGVPVLAHITNSHGKTRRLRAQWIAKHTDELWDGDDMAGDYSEETDTTYTPEGWYETNEYEETHFHINDPVSHWMPLPPGPDQASTPVEPKPSEATEIPTVRRWNAKYPGISMLEHNGELVRSGFGPYVLAEDYDRLSRTLAAIEKARAIERKARQRLQTELLALCTEHVGGELDPDNANPAGNSHHE